MPIPSKPFETIALTMSGGGYRATAFHLGALKYLDKCQYQGKTLLERVKVISTVSGGTFTGVMYAATLQKGGTLKDCEEALYSFMKDVKLIDDSLDSLSKPDFNKFKTPNLINAFAETYFKKMTGDRFELFWNGKETHLSEIIFNAVEFSHGINFRFQKTRFDGGFIGNKHVQTDVEAMRGVRLADIIASSSCFPAGFEPLSFPADYRNTGADAFNKYADELLASSNPDFPMYIMDGGIYDNQGIDATLLANDRMRNYPEMKGKEQPIDLIIISDVASPFMDPLKIKTSAKDSWWKRLNLRLIRRLGYLVWLLTAAAAFMVFQADQKGWVIFWSVLVALGLVKAFVLTFIGGFLVKKAPKWFNVPPMFMKPLHFFHRLSFGVYEHLIVERKDSVIKMVSEVFLKQIRRLSYRLIYEDKAWEHRRITNAIYELTPADFAESKQKKEIPDDIGEPSAKVYKTATDASNMGTTLWFSEEDLLGRENMIDKLVQCGEFTMCYNLIVYLWRLRNDKSYSTLDAAIRADLEDLYARMLGDWRGYN